MSTHTSDVDYPYRADSGTSNTGLDERSPSYSDIHHMANGVPLGDGGGGGGGGGVTGDEEPPTIQEPPYPSVYRAMSTQNVVVISPRSSGSPQQQQQHVQQGLPLHPRQQDSQPSSQALTPFLQAPTVYISPSGLHATLELESDTVEIYDRSNDGFQYSLKGSVDLGWIGDMELLLKDAQVDFMGYADTAILRHESGAGSAATETPVHHTHDFIPTPLVLAQQASSIPPSTTIGSSSNSDEPSISQHQKSLAIDLTLPGHLPDTTNLGIGKIRYELQVSLELTWAPGTSATTTEKFILRRPVLVHRIVYPSSHLQPRLAMGLDSGGVEIQVKVPRLLHCENTLLAVELYAKPRTRNVRLYKAKVVFEQIETDRYQRSSAAAVPRAVVPLATAANASATSPSLNPTAFPTALHQQQPAGPPPVPRLVTRKIAQPLEVLFDEPTTELQSQNLHLQLVLSPDLCVDVQSSWLQVSHTLRVEIEYSTDEETYVTAPPVSAPPPPPLLSALEIEGVELSKAIEGANELETQDDNGDDDGGAAGTEPGGLWDQEGDAIEDDDDDDDGRPSSLNDNEASDGVNGDNEDGRPQYILDEKRAVRAVMDHDVGSGSSTVPDHHHHLLSIQDIDRPPSPPLLPLFSPQSPSSSVVVTAGEGGSLHPQSPGQPSIQRHPSTLIRPTIGCSSASGVSSTSSTYSLATEEIPVRVVRVVATALVDASTIAQAAGETEAGLPTYESVMEATGLPAYAEEKLEDDHEDAEASGTVSGVLGGAARRLEGYDAEVERRSS
ncbi:hypothetical protein K457DRAFT_252123 [Linnemannia elongata AG-77]|uniref:Uncharacterized protein n=1 Tax=Linnemannia elongata AG-77 TaxID=1314771 RepID=A0A197K9M4_9FUNG|nr:hypothetical protein K457DRAFT_252123 [Linnemannia elongata AG-77]